MTNTYLIAGQSNALGISPVSDLAQPCEYPGVFLYQASNVSVPFGHTIISVRPGLGIKEDKFGLELGAARACRGERTCLIKYASDGTSLYDRWSPGGRDFLGMKETFLLGMAAFRAAGFDPVLKGVLWMQGENDASFPAQAAAYGENLKSFIGAVRAFAGDIPFAVGETNPHNAALPYVGAVNAAKRRAAKECGRVIYVPTGDLNDLADMYHYGAEDMLALGERLMRALQEE
jgi:hypothetical protein